MTCSFCFATKDINVYWRCITFHQMHLAVISNFWQWGSSWYFYGQLATSTLLWILRFKNIPLNEDCFLITLANLNILVDMLNGLFVALGSKKCPLYFESMCLWCTYVRIPVFKTYLEMGGNFCYLSIAK